MKTPRDSSSPNPQESKRESEPGQSSSAGPVPLTLNEMLRNLEKGYSREFALMYLADKVWEALGV